jgi:hypothetical protein
MSSGTTVNIHITIIIQLEPERLIRQKRGALSTQPKEAIISA